MSPKRLTRSRLQKKNALPEEAAWSPDPSWMDQLRTAPAPRVTRRKSAIVIKPAGPRREAPPFDPTGALAGAMLRQVLNPALRARIKRREAVFVIVETPSAAWCEPMCEVAREMLAAVHTTRATVPRRAGAGAELSVVDEPLLAFTPERDFFHPSVVAAADVILCARITSSLVARAIEQCYGTRPPVSAETIAGLDFHDLLLALRPRSSAWRGPAPPGETRSPKTIRCARSTSWSDMARSLLTSAGSQPTPCGFATASWRARCCRLCFCMASRGPERRSSSVRSPRPPKFPS
jgi:hypothetical protein